MQHIRKSREGGIREGGVSQICRKLRAPNLHKNVGISFRTSEKGCAKLSQICREFESKFRTNLCKYLFSNAPFSKYLTYTHVASFAGWMRGNCLTGLTWCCGEGPADPGTTEPSLNSDKKVSPRAGCPGLTAFSRSLRVKFVKHLIRTPSLPKMTRSTFSEVSVLFPEEERIC